MNLRETIRSLLPGSPKKHTIKSGPLAGKKIVTSWHDYPAAILGYAESALVEWLLENVQPGETWLDVGAHYGYTSLAMCERVGSHGRVFAFEPCISTAVCLEQTRSLNGHDEWKIVPLALSDDEGITLRYSPTTRGMVDQQAGVQGADGVKGFLAVALDSIWESLSMNNPIIDGVKVDVQGMELETLRGMRGALTSHRPKLILEVHRDVSRPEILEVLSGCDYRVKPIPIEKAIATDFFDPMSNYSFLFLPR